MKKLYIYIMCSLLATSLSAQNGFGSYLRDVIQKQEKGILVYAKLIEACGLCDSLDLLKDYEYEIRYEQGKIPININCYGGYTNYIFYAPEHRLYGYTLFAETDEFWESKLGKNYKSITVANVARYIRQNCQFPKSYGTGTDYSNPENMLYQFVTYHLLNRRLSSSTLVNHVNEYGYDRNKPQKPGVPVCEYYTTMGDRRLLRVYESMESQGIYLNRFPVLDNGRRGSYHELSCDPDKTGILIGEPSTNLVNAVIYPINELLAFDKATAQNMGSIRLRMDVTSFFPEMATNGIRLSPVTDDRHKNVYLPCDIYPYLDDLTVNNYETKFCYWTGMGSGWQNMQGDEIACMGRQDITLRLPPVPKSGTYEIRMGTQSGNSNRSTIQAFFGERKDILPPIGMPMDFRQAAYELRTSSGYITSYIGYEADTDDDYLNQMHDNELHENNFMKGCNQYVAGGAGSTNTMRDSNICLRRILGRVTMDADKTYYLRLRNVLDTETSQLYMDYIEFCPQSIYDNPNEPEDIW